MNCTKNKALDNFDIKYSLKFFCILGVIHNFLEIDPEAWNENEDFNIARNVLCSLTITNDHAGRGVT